MLCTLQQANKASYRHTATATKTWRVTHFLSRGKELVSGDTGKTKTKEDYKGSIPHQFHRGVARTCQTKKAASDMNQLTEGLSLTTLDPKNPETPVLYAFPRVWINHPLSPSARKAEVPKLLKLPANVSEKKSGKWPNYLGPWTCK